jgi:pimeloyl-ACP methyl ester carboxylesterase
MFEEAAAALADSHRVVRYDHRGQGASARAPREQLDMDTQAQDAAALIEALGRSGLAVAKLDCASGLIMAVRTSAAPIQVAT